MKRSTHATCAHRSPHPGAQYIFFSWTTLEDIVSLLKLKEQFKNWASLAQDLIRLIDRLVEEEKTTSIFLEILLISFHKFLTGLVGEFVLYQYLENLRVGS